MYLSAATAQGQTIIHVDDDAPAAGDGATWATAYRFLQDALADAAATPGDVEIHLAQGTYSPDRDELNPVGTGNRTATFTIIDGTALFGGYAGLGAPDPNLRDPILFESSLSGDLAGDDVMPGFLNMGENSELVVELLSTNTTIVLDGLVIEGGQSGPLAAQGAGVRILGGDAAISSCVFRRNVAAAIDAFNPGQGGALHILDAQVAADNCQFLDNVATDGGAVWMGLSTPLRSDFSDCHFEGNLGSGFGSTIYVDGTALGASNEPVLHLDQCSVVANAPAPGEGFLTGTVTVEGAPCWISNSSFVGNTAGFGSAVLLFDDRFSVRSRLVNCLFVGNVATSNFSDFFNFNFGSSAVSLGSVNADIINCTFLENQGAEFGAAFHSANSVARLANCILWSNHAAFAKNQQDDQIFVLFPVLMSLEIVDCDIQGWDFSLGILGNAIDQDPGFVDPVGPDGMVGTGDEDLRLRPGSPCIDAGDRGLLEDGIPDIFDRDGDGDFVEPIPVDFYGQPRLRDDPLTADTGGGGCVLPDIGAAEFDGLDPEVADSYVGLASGSWSTAGNWALGVTPDCDTTALLNAVVTVDVPGALASTVIVDGSGAVVISTGSLTINRLILRSGATLVLNDATAVLNAREIVMEPGSQLNWIAGTVNLRFGRWDTSTAMSFGQIGAASLVLLEQATVSSPTLTVGVFGELTGSGTIDGDLVNQGVVAPDLGTTAYTALLVHLQSQLDYGRINVLGDYSQASSGRLRINTKGLVQVSDYDYLQVFQSAQLDGTVEVEVGQNSQGQTFEPQAQDTFDILDAASRTGVFNTIIAPVTTGALTFDVNYRADGATLFMVATQPPRTLFVDDDATPGGDGLSWATAYDDFYDAIADANVGDEIRVAQGIYRRIEFPPFELRSGIAWRGGFAGLGQPDPDARDPEMFQSILSGDINGDDDLPGGGTDDNTWPLVSADGINLTAILDGFVLEAASGSPLYFFRSRGPRVENCLFRNTGEIFLFNFSTATENSIQFINCRFENMSGFNRGGAIRVLGRWFAEFQGCDFVDNQLPVGGYGGAIFCEEGSRVSISDSTFSGNFAVERAGAIGTSGLELTLSNCVFINNSAGLIGGALSLIGTVQATLSGLQFSGNSAPEAPGLEIASDQGVRPTVNAIGPIGDGVKNNGIIRPGLGGPGRVSIDGDFTQDLIDIISFFSVPVHGILDIDLGGTTPEFGHDVVDITGNFLGRGTLQVGFINSFLPLNGDTFNIITASSIVKPFDAALMPGFPDGRYLRLVYNSGPLSKGGAVGGASVSLVVDTLDFLLSFDDALNFAIGDVPVNSMLADIDGVNGPDLIVVIPGAVPTNPGSVIILFNGGTDGLGPWTGFTSFSSQIPVGTEPTGVEAGFFDADADIDLAVTNSGDNTVTILLNNGDGTFASSTVAVGLAPSDLVKGNFAGGEDLAVANAGDDTITILANDGAGGFTIAETLDVDGDPLTTSSPRAITAADFDRNGLDDLAVANQTANTVSVLLAGVPATKTSSSKNTTQAKIFLLPFIIPVDLRPIDITPIDIDNDKDLDLVTANFDGNSVSLIKNTNFGTFSTSSSLPIGNQPRSLTIGDFDSDGDDDIAVVVDDDLGNAVVKILRNETDGSGTMIFAHDEDLAQGEETDIVIYGDVTGDDMQDLVTINKSVAPPGSAKLFGATALSAGTAGSVAVRQNASGLSCPADTNGDTMVNVTDLLELLASWGSCPNPCPPDINFDGNVNVTDLLALLAAWGACP